MAEAIEDAFEVTSALRTFSPPDLGQVLDLWQAQVGAEAGLCLSVDQLVDLVGSQDAVAIVAEVERSVAGIALGTATGVVGWIPLVAVDGAHDARGDLSHQLLEEVEVKLAEKGVRRIAALAPVGANVRAAFETRGYHSTTVDLMQRDVSPVAATPSALAELGGRMIDRGLWDDLKGMEEAKEIIERRVILPLAEPELAARHSIAPPRAIVLFGPPGTGKTTFAKGIASRLEWPFIEIHPAELAAEGAERQGKLLGHVFDLVLDLAAAVVFVDEVEDVAAERDAERKVSPSVANEFLKQIPRFRDAPHHLLVCATNAIGSLDSAFLRPGRFDYVLPVGLPDEEARHAIWQRYVRDITDDDVDINELVEATELFTPADIEFAARKAAQRAFEREHFGDSPGRATTEDFLFAIKRTRPSLSEDSIDAFRKEMKKFARD